MATLANQKPSNTFDSLLHIEDDTSGLVATSTDSRVVQDGVGANSALALSTDSVRITSTNKLYFNDIGDEYISGNTAILSIVGGDEIDLTATAIDINGTVDISGTTTVGGSDPRLVIGTSTPDSWFTTTFDMCVFQMGNMTYSSDDRQQAGSFGSITNNAYMRTSDGQWVYAVGSEEATLYQSLNGTHSFKNAGTGSADAAITFIDSLIIDSAGLITVDKTINNHKVGTQYAYFGCASSAALPPIANTHYPVAFSSMIFSSSSLSLGNGANPALVLDISGLNQADDLVTYLWYIPDNITVAGVYVWASPDGATGDALTFHLMSYTIDTSLDAAGDGGDLSSGVVVADHVGTVTSDGYESTINKSLTIQSANIDAGDVAMFTMAADGTNGNYAMNVTVKYYLR